MPLFSSMRLGGSQPPEPDENDGVFARIAWRADWLKRQAELKAFEVTKNVAIDAAHQAANMAGEHAPDVLRRTPKSAMDRLSPHNVFRALHNPQAIADYDWQYVEILLNQMHMMMHPLAHARQNYNSFKYPLSVGRFFFGQMDKDSWSSPLFHTTRAMGEQFKDKLSDLIVIFALTKAILKVPRYKARVEGMRDWLFPRDSWKWRWARNPIGNVFVTNSPSRLLGLPHIFFGLLLYQHLGNIGRSLESEAALRDHPETRDVYSALVAMHKEHILANSTVDMIDNYQATSRKKQSASAFMYRTPPEIPADPSSGAEGKWRDIWRA